MEKMGSIGRGIEREVLGERLTKSSIVRIQAPHLINLLKGSNGNDWKVSAEALCL